MVKVVDFTLRAFYHSKKKKNQKQNIKGGKEKEQEVI